MREEREDYEDADALLQVDLEVLNGRLDGRIDRLIAEAEELGISPDILQYPNGSNPLDDLLCAKANVLHSLILLREDF